MTPPAPPKTIVLFVRECPFCGRFGENADVMGCYVCQRRWRIYAAQLREDLKGGLPPWSVMERVAKVGDIDRAEGLQAGVYMPALGLLGRGEVTA